jgi:hydroxypyruvate isomerase
MAAQSFEPTAEDRMEPNPLLSRRAAMKITAAGLSGVALGGAGTSVTAVPKAQYMQAVARWCYHDMSVEDLARAAAGLGIKGMDLVESADWPALKKYGLVCSMANGAGTIADGLNRKENHEKLEAEFRKNIPLAAEAGMPNVITFSGNRRGLSDQEGLENCIAGLTRIKGIAEQNNVTVCLELLNSKVDHKDYMCDHSAWGVEVVRKVNSPRVRLLYDIYHMQIMEGDIIRTIRENIRWIGHFHTGGVPGRNELDETQELNWPAIMRAIAECGFTGFVAHEFVPTRDPLGSLAQAVRTCAV